ncbi:MAG: DUF1223 domain-containing protein [Terracidiphilus sp.]|jgi:hypothetical protein
MTSPTSDCFRRARVAVTLVATALLLCLPAAGQASAASTPAATQPTPVLVELFTSEGCSDCPPADALLAQLDTQVIPGAQVIVLSEHVTYWNHQGWMDPFSFDEIDLRQQSYVRQFGLDSPATPQFVVDGTMQLAGSNPPVLAGFITRAAAVPKIQIEIGNAHRAANGAVEFTVHAATATKATLVAIIAENATHSEVSHGENAGRTLHHVAVVRAIKEFGSNFGSGATDGRTLELSGGNVLRAEKDGEPLRLVVFLVSHSRVVGAAEQTLNP